MIDLTVYTATYIEDRDMLILLPHNNYDPAHLSSVKDEMSRLGAPTVKAIWIECYGAWVALEGAHRLRAAHALGLVPIISPVELSGMTATTDDVVPGSYEDNWTIGRIVADAYACKLLDFSED